MKEKEIKSRKELKEVAKGFIFHCRFEKNLTDKTIKAYNTDLKQFQLYVERKGIVANLRFITRDVIKD